MFFLDMSPAPVLQGRGLLFQTRLNLFLSIVVIGRFMCFAALFRWQVFADRALVLRNEASAKLLANFHHHAFGSNEKGGIDSGAIPPMSPHSIFWCPRQRNRRLTFSDTIRAWTG